MDNKTIEKEILNFISEIEIKKEPEWTNTIKNNLMVFYSWLLEKNYLASLLDVKELREENKKLSVLLDNGLTKAEAGEEIMKLRVDNKTLIFNVSEFIKQRDLMQAEIEKLKEHLEAETECVDHMKDVTGNYEAEISELKSKEVLSDRKIVELEHEKTILKSKLDQPVVSEKEVAVGFAEWIDKNYFRLDVNKYCFCYSNQSLEDTKKFTIAELYELYLTSINRGE